MENSLLIRLLLRITIRPEEEAQDIAKESLETSPSTTTSQENLTRLYQFGIADAFVNGLYRGWLPVSELKSKGDFGLGAPNLIDGELTLYEGKVYQTKADGTTTEAPDTLTSPFAFVNYFTPNIRFQINGISNKENILKLTDLHLRNDDGIYAIRISGKFKHVKTRAFAAVKKEPFIPLTSMPEQQHFFDLNNEEGVLVGYKHPAYLAGINVEGFHFHFLNRQLSSGGHAVDFTSTDITIEICEINHFEMVIPDNEEFADYPFSFNENSKY